MVAAALDANWLRPGGYHGHALDQVDQLLLVNNQLDPAMRFYHLALEGRMRPLGYAGPLGIVGHDGVASRVRSIDVTAAVGRHHALAEYLSASSQVGRVLEQVAQFTPPASIDASLAERADARQQVCAEATVRHLDALFECVHGPLPTERRDPHSASAR